MLLLFSKGPYQAVMQVDIYKIKVLHYPIISAASTNKKHQFCEHKIGIKV